MSYTLTELIEKLEELVEEYPDLEDQKVNMAFQENYPLAGLITSVTVIEDDEDSDCECPSTKSCDECPKPKLWIGIQDNYNTPYAPKEAWND